MHIEVFEDHEWADQVAKRWVSHMSHHPDSRICLPTGETPRPVYTRSAPQVDLNEATIFLLDEFDLPLGSAARCDSMLKRDLLGSLTKPPGAFHQLDVNAADPETECARFDALVGDGGLRLTLLGLGGNGHLGLNEPGTAADSPTRPVRLTPTTTQAAARYDADARPVGGLTLGMQRILGSDEIWLLVTGSHKAAVLGEMMNGPITPNLPASYLRNHHHTIVFADSSAAAGL
jgi:glucosamine-6-phosphate deaminase